MSKKSEYVSKAHFYVEYRLTSLRGKVVNGAPWCLYSDRLYTYMAACEEAERLRGQDEGFLFRAAYEKLVEK